MKRINLNDMKHDMGDDLRLECDGDPFAGEVVEEAAGLLFAQLFYVDGVRHGSSREWWDNGSLKSYGENYHGWPRGSHRKWHRNGKLAAESLFSEVGDLIFRRRWDRHGIPVAPSSPSECWGLKLIGPDGRYEAGSVKSEGLAKWLLSPTLRNIAREIVAVGTSVSTGAEESADGLVMTREKSPDMGFMEQLTGPLMAGGWVSRDSISGCTQEGIENLLRSQGVERMPESYREFLEYGGRDPYWLSREGEWDYDWLLEAKDVAREIAVDDYEEDFSPFESGFIFQTHQGYMFFYFREEDLHAADPRFWIFKGGSPVQMSSLTFNQWLADLARTLPEELRLRQRLYGR